MFDRSWWGIGTRSGLVFVACAGSLAACTVDMAADDADRSTGDAAESGSGGTSGAGSGDAEGGTKDDGGASEGTTGSDSGGETTADEGPSSSADSADDAGDGEDSSDADTGDQLDPAGRVETQILTPYPAGTELALEDYFATHWIHGSPGSHLAQQMYVGSCLGDGSKPRVFASVSLGNHEDCADEDGLDRYGHGGCGGALIELAYTDGEGLTDTRVRSMPECIEAYGVVAATDCSGVAVLCRRENLATVDAADEITKNSLLSAKDPDWMTHPTNDAGDGRRMDEIWMYEWPDGDIEAEPEKYVLHRAIGTSYGKYSLIRGTDETYGIGIRSDLFSDDGTMHSADAMLVLDAGSHEYLDRGYDWACGVGHTTTNFMTFHPVSQSYAMHCMTDYNDDQLPAGDSYLRLENGGKDNDGDGKKNGYFRHQRWGGGGELGGALMLVPVSDGGFLAAIVGLPGDEDKHEESFHEAPVPTSVGVTRFDAMGRVVGEIQWLERDDDGLVSSPQLAPLGDDRFLFGWGTMHRFASYEDDRHTDYKLAHQYHVYEIDDMGRRMSETLDLPAEVGWGEWDEMTPMGPGRLAWVHTAPATVPLEDAASSQFPLDRAKLATHVYIRAGR